jgi:uncharacterized repeat protein (TIGR03806 family)
MLPAGGAGTTGASAGMGGTTGGSSGAAGMALGGAGMASGGAGMASGGAGMASGGGSTGGAGTGSGGAAAGAGGAPATGCIVPDSADAQPMLLSQTGCVNPAKPTEAASSLIFYDVNSPLWSDAAVKERFVSLPAGSKIHVKDCSAEPDTCMPIDQGGTGEDEGHWDLPVGTVLMKSFRVNGKLIETRLLEHRNESTWQGYSYEWNDDESDATLLADQKDKPVGDQTWHYPSRSQCLECHTKGGGRSLGPTTPQLNRDHDYGSGAVNQIDHFESLGLFDAPPKRIDGYPDPKGTADVELRARSYLQANCSICHRPGGPISDVDLRFVTSFKDTQLCNQPVTMGTGDPKLPQVRLVPGDPSKSSLSFRMHDRTDYKMPKIGSNVVDPDGTAVVDAWITSLQSCPQ